MPLGVGVNILEFSNNSLKYELSIYESYDDDLLLTAFKVESLLNEAFIRNHIGEKTNITFNDIPKSRDPFLMFVREIVQIVILSSYLLPVISICETITLEKEHQLKEYMKITGIQTYLHWFSFFITYIVPLTVISLLITCVLKVEPGVRYQILPKTEFTVLWVFLLCYSFSTIGFSFMISSISSHANLATKLAIITWFVIFIPFPLTGYSFEEHPLYQKLILCLFSNTAMAFGISKIVDAELKERDSIWNNIFDEVDANMSIGHAIVMLLADSFIYMLIAMYVEKIYPGAYGIPLKWYFPFTKKFWCGTQIKRGESMDFGNAQQHAIILQTLLENAGRVTVDIRNLKKVYAGNKVAVKGISLKLYEDDIVILLGHNGAGKSTTISMLTGLLPPTSGTILINDYDIQEDTELAQASMGLCPQHNILFNDLTVREHIIFYSEMRDITGVQLKLNIIKLGKDLLLADQLDTIVQNLSGGVKRTLSVGLAFCGDPKFVLLDEPSSGRIFLISLKLNNMYTAQFFE